MELLDGPEVSVLNQVLASLRFQLAAVASGDDAVADAGLFGSAPPIIVAYGIHVYG